MFEYKCCIRVAQTERERERTIAQRATHTHSLHQTGPFETSTLVKGQHSCFTADKYLWKNIGVCETANSPVRVCFPLTPSVSLQHRAAVRGHRASVVGSRPTPIYSIFQRAVDRTTNPSLWHQMPFSLTCFPWH